MEEYENSESTYLLKNKLELQLFTEQLYLKRELEDQWKGFTI